ncbi:hypothetical protein [Microbacterium sp.]|uniref:hypothetical protein n=1 Tax=Microbacterium sp. TaxID=51671 RepID=UPI0028118646|nr:hypothetical protein [Microbacterium sp.]
MTQSARPATGASAWALGLLVLLPIPLLGPLAAGGGMVAAYGSLSRQGPLAAANARSAKRWGTFFLLVSTGLLVLQLGIAVALLWMPPQPRGLFPVAIPMTLYVVVCVVHLVVVIVGTLRARRGEVVRIPFGRSAT